MAYDGDYKAGGGSTKKTRMASGMKNIPGGKSKQVRSNQNKNKPRGKKSYG